MAVNTTSMEEGEIGLIQVLDGRIIQIGLTHAQNKQLQMFLGVLSQEHPLVQMGEDHDLIMKPEEETT